MKVSNGNIEIECARAAPIQNGAICYDEAGNEVARFSGVQEGVLVIEGGEWSASEPTAEERFTAENTLLKAQIQALVERGEFVEDCIAEMAMHVYE